MFYTHTCINFTRHKQNKSVKSYAVNAVQVVKCAYTNARVQKSSWHEENLVSVKGPPVKRPFFQLSPLGAFLKQVRLYMWHQMSLQRPSNTHEISLQITSPDLWYSHIGLWLEDLFVFKSSVKVWGMDHSMQLNFTIFVCFSLSLFLIWTFSWLVSLACASACPSFTHGAPICITCRQTVLFLIHHVNLLFCLSA